MPWKDEDAKIIREMIKQESDVSNHRLTWMVTLQGLLFAALGFAWKEGKALITVLAIIGFLSSVSSLIGLYIAHKATSKLLDSWKRNKPKGYDGPDVIGHFVKSRLVTYALPWFLLPFLFISAWIAVFCINYAR